MNESKSRLKKWKTTPTNPLLWPGCQHYCSQSQGLRRPLCSCRALKLAKRNNRESMYHLLEHLSSSTYNRAFPINPSSVDNTIKSKIYLIHLAYWTPRLSLAGFKHIRTCTLALVGLNHLTQSLFYIKCWIVCEIYWIQFWKWKTEQLEAYCAFSPWDPRGWPGAVAHCHCPASGERSKPQVSCLEKITIQNWEYRFYWTRITSTGL